MRSGTIGLYKVAAGLTVLSLWVVSCGKPAVDVELESVLATLMEGHVVDLSQTVNQDQLVAESYRAYMEEVFPSLPALA